MKTLIVISMCWIGSVVGFIPKLPPFVSMITDEIASNLDTLMSASNNNLGDLFSPEKFGNMRDVIDSYYVSYYFRQNLYALVFSESHPIGQIQHFLMTSNFDIFNFILFTTALGFFVKDFSSKKSIDKLLQKGIITKKTIRNFEIFILVVTTVMTKDVENATGMVMGL
jgi:hypothetical protein